MHKIKKLLQDKLKSMENLTELSVGNLDQIHKITDTIKNIDKIEKLEGGGEYSNARGMSYDSGGSYARDGRYSGDYDDEESYEGGNSGARRGSHYVRGHYSRGDGYSGRRGGGRYSMDDGKEDVMEILDGMLNGVEDGRQREAIMRFKREMERM